MKITKLVATLFCIGAFTAGAVHATQAQAPQQQTSKTSYSDKQVNAFAKAYLKVVEIQNKEQAKLGENLPEEKVKAELAKINVKLEKAINDQKNMNTDLYSKIMSDLQKNPKLMAQVQKKVQNLRQ